MSRKQTIVIKATIDMVVTLDVGDDYNPVATAYEKARKANFIRSVEVSDEVELYEVGKVEVSQSFKAMESFSEDRDGLSTGASILCGFEVRRNSLSTTLTTQPRSRKTWLCSTTQRKKNFLKCRLLERHW